VKKYKIIIESTANHDLKDILRYFIETLKEPASAKRAYSSIKKQITQLDEMPLRFPLVRDEHLAARGIRWMLSGNYTAFYITDETLREVHILRILYNRRDWQNLL